MSDRFPLYPELSEDGREHVESITKEFTEQFKKKLQEVLDELIGEFESNVILYAETDAWTNFRSELMSGLTNYRNREIQGRYDYDRIRQAIYQQYKDEIIKDLDQDNLKEIEKLKEELRSVRRQNEEMSKRLYNY